MLIAPQLHVYFNGILSIIIKIQDEHTCRRLTSFELAIDFQNVLTKFIVFTGLVKFKLVLFLFTFSFGLSLTGVLIVSIWTFYYNINFKYLGDLISPKFNKDDFSSFVIAVAKLNFSKTTFYFLIKKF